MLMITTPNGKLELRSFGKSMYGGWYLDYYDFNLEKMDGIKRNTLRELCEWAGVDKSTMIKRVKRWDN